MLPSGDSCSCKLFICKIPNIIPASSQYCIRDLARLEVKHNETTSHVSKVEREVEGEGGSGGVSERGGNRKNRTMGTSREREFRDLTVKIQFGRDLSRRRWGVGKGGSDVSLHKRGLFKCSNCPMTFGFFETANQKREFSYKYRPRRTALIHFNPFFLSQRLFHRD